MTKVTFYPQSPVPETELKYAVIAARFQGQWIFCRHRQRQTWEIPGGHREPGETADEAARQELWEETGVSDAEIRRIGVYGVARDGAETFGMLYFAEVHALGVRPEESEIAENTILQNLPAALTYPDIQPQLFKWVQGWLNMQSNAGELWDIYDGDRILTGRTHRRGEFLAEGDYHLVVHVWMLNSRGQFLLTKRSPNKGFPNMWETTGGSALAGDDSLTAALREVREETGLTLDPHNGKQVITYKGRDYITDVWLFRQDFDLKDVALLEGETCGKMYASREDIQRMREENTLVPYSYLDKLFEISHSAK